MKSPFPVPTALEIRSLLNVSLGREKADLVIVGGDLVNVYTGEIQKNRSVAVKGEKVACVGEDVSHAIGEETKVIDASGKTLIPGFIDGHTHALWLHSLPEVIRYAMKCGTTTIISETADFSYTLGYDGVIQFLESTKDQPIKVFVTLPSIVSTGQPGYRDAIAPHEFRELLGLNGVLGLGESHWIPVVRGDRCTLELFAETLSRGMRAEGHSAGARERRIVAFAASGISSCHESINAEEALEKLRLGMHVMVREGDTREDLESVSSIKDAGIGFRYLTLTSDTLGARQVIRHGYLDHVVQKAINLEFDPVTAIQMATLNVAEHFSLDGMIGGIAPGKYADILIVPKPDWIKPEWVISSGRMVAREGELLVEPKMYRYPESSRTTVRIPRRITADDFAVPVESNDHDVLVRVIDLTENIANHEVLLQMPVTGGELIPDVQRDILKVAAIDRKYNQAQMSTGFVRGFRLRKGAFAATANWNVSNVLVVGAVEEDMAGAVNRIHELQGGAVVYADGRVLAELALPIAGYASEASMESIATGLERIKVELSRLGCTMPDAHLMLTTMTCAIIPTLRISCEGLLDVREGKLVDLIAGSW